MKPALKIEPGYRSKLERDIATQLHSAGIVFGYEQMKLSVSFPPRVGKYITDFNVRHIIIEGKGWFGRRSAHERQKFILAKEQHPDVDIRFVFQDARKPIYKGSKTTYADWARDHNFKFSDKGAIPKEWLRELKSLQQNASSIKLKKANQDVGSGKGRAISKATVTKG